MAGHHRAEKNKIQIINPIASRTDPDSNTSVQLFYTTLESEMCQKLSKDQIHFWTHEFLELGE